MPSRLNITLMQLKRRAERNDPATLTATFVDVGSLFTLLSSEDHQVLYGRRGTGKTHVLQYLTENRRSAGDIAVYVDMRTIGSAGGVYADPAVPITERGTRLLADTLSHVYNALQGEVLDVSYTSDDDFTSTMANLDMLGASLTDVRVTGDEEVESSHGDATKQSDSSSLSVGMTGRTPNLSAKLGSASESGTNDTTRRLIRGPVRQRVHFGAISGAISAVVGSMPGRLWVVLDEWSDVPLDLQPLLADLIRRCLMPVGGVTVKIGAIEQRSNFMQLDGAGGYVGMELGPDISADVDLDDFMVFGNDAAKAREFFEELMFRHVQLEMNDQGGCASHSQGICSTSIHAAKRLRRICAGCRRRPARRPEHRNDRGTTGE